MVVVLGSSVYWTKLFSGRDFYEVYTKIYNFDQYYRKISFPLQNDRDLYQRFLSNNMTKMAGKENFTRKTEIIFQNQMSNIKQYTHSWHVTELLCLTGTFVVKS